LEFNVPFQHKYSHITEVRGGELSIPSEERPTTY